MMELFAVLSSINFDLRAPWPDFSVAHPLLSKSVTVVLSEAEGFTGREETERRDTSLNHTHQPMSLCFAPHIVQ